MPGDSTTAPGLNLSSSSSSSSSPVSSSSRRLVPSSAGTEAPTAVGPTKQVTECHTARRPASQPASARRFSNDVDVASGVTSGPSVSRRTGVCSPEQPPLKASIQPRNNHPELIASTSSPSSSPSNSPLSPARAYRGTCQADSRLLPVVGSTGIMTDPQRSLSVKSQMSEGTNTDGGYSSSGRESLMPVSSSRRGSRNARASALARDGGESTVSSLGRSGSSASTVPTSPGLEPVPPVPAQKLGLSQAPIISAASRYQPDDSCTSTAQGAPLPTIYSVGDVAQHEIRPPLTTVPQAAPTLSHRNKPLPSPGSQSSDRSPGERKDDETTTEPPSRPASRNALRSAINQGTKYLRRSSMGPKKASLSMSSEVGSSDSVARVTSEVTAPATGDPNKNVHSRSHSPFPFRRKSKMSLVSATDNGRTAPPLPDDAPLRSADDCIRDSAGTSSPYVQVSRSDAHPDQPLSTSLGRPGSCATSSHSKPHHSPNSGCTGSSANLYAHRKSYSMARVGSDNSGCNTSSHSRPTMPRGRSSTIGELRSLAEGSEETAGMKVVSGQYDTLPHPSRASTSDLIASPRQRQSRWSRVMGKHGFSEPTASADNGELSHASGSVLRASLDTYDSRYSRDSASALPTRETVKASHGSEVRSPNSTLSSGETASPLKRSPIPSIASSSSSWNTATARKSIRHPDVEGNRVSKIDEATKHHLGNAKPPAPLPKDFATSKEGEGRSITPLSPATISMWSSAVASEINLAESQQAGYGRYEVDALHHDRGEEAADLSSTEPSQYHDALSSPEPAPSPESRPQGAAPRRMEAENGQSISSASSQRSSKRATFSRTLSTMFDPRPSLEGRIFTAPPPPPPYVQYSLMRGRTNANGYTHPLEAPGKRFVNSSYDAERSTGPAGHTVTVTNAKAGRSKASGPAKNPERIHSNEYKESSSAARNVTKSSNVDRSAKKSLDSATLLVGRQDPAHSRVRAAELAKQRAQGPAEPLAPSKLSTVPPTKLTKHSQEAKISSTPSASQSSGSTLSRLRKRSLTSLSTVRSSSAVSSSVKMTSSRPTVPGSRDAGADTMADKQSKLPSKNKSAASSLSAGITAKKMIRAASALDMNDRRDATDITGEERPRFIRHDQHHQQMKEIDDRAFLNLLESARREHKEITAKKFNSAAKGGESSTSLSQPNENGAMSSSRGGSVKGKDGTALRRPALHRRVSSADGRLGSDRPADRSRDALASTAEDQSPSAEQEGLDPSPLTSAVRLFDVGHASGRTTDVFSNDDEWKREVRALFVIRELLNTEQSYARHLETLLSAVRRKAATPSASPASSHSRRKSSSSLLGSDLNLSASSALVSRSSSNAASERYLPLMRNLLPQLIALSRSLAARIDANPTAAGVGGAFLSIAPQLEATFVAWSKAAQEIMTGLRLTQGPKGKMKDRLMMTPTIDTDSSVFKVSAVETQASTRPTPPLKDPSSGRPTTPTRSSSRSASFTATSDIPPPSANQNKTRSFSAGGGGGRPSASPKQIGKTDSSLAMSTVGEIGIVSSPEELDESPFSDQSRDHPSEPSPPAPVTTVHAPSRPVSPWGIAASTKRGLAAVTRKQSWDKDGSWISLSRRQSFSTTTTAVSTTAASTVGTNTNNTGGGSGESSSLMAIPISRVGSRSGSTTPLLPNAPSTSPVQSSSLMGAGALHAHGIPSTNSSFNGTGSGIGTSIGTGSGAAGGGGGRALSALDVAIMPMQRPPRYLLLLTDLIKHTSPESESHRKVRESLEKLRVVARKCDEASPER